VPEVSMKVSVSHDAEHPYPILNRLTGSIAAAPGEREHTPSRAGSRAILGMRVDAASYLETVDTIASWAKYREPRYVCVSTVHMVMEAYDDPGFRAIVNDADIVTSDGMPLVWGLRLLGLRNASRVYGPTLTPMLCEWAARDGIPVGFYGGTPETLRKMLERLERDIPGLNVVYRHSPPFRQLTSIEVEREIAEIRASGARIVFVGLGCPKQERWMAARSGRLPAVLVGVGAAFDYVAQTKRQAPPLLQRLGLEWLFRMVAEPRRLWRRYLYNNPRFVVLFGLQLLRTHLSGRHERA
jgi:N-acetylglucosaminyldiphosphoundecaprenol N-acetyl-beta-D-mannosaminyltransferase